jgi:hypothetical protein
MKRQPLRLMRRYTRLLLMLPQRHYRLSRLPGRRTTRFQTPIRFQKLRRKPSRRYLPIPPICGREVD